MVVCEQKKIVEGEYFLLFYWIVYIFFIRLYVKIKTMI